MDNATKSQNIYDNQSFFDGYGNLNRSKLGLNGAPEWDTIKSILPNLNDKVVIDLGSGYGWFCRFAQEEGGAKKVVGIDLSELMTKKAIELTKSELIEQNKIEYQISDLETVDLPINTYDFVYSSLAFHYIKDFKRLAQTIYQSLKPGGKMVFNVEHPIYSSADNWISINTESNNGVGQQQKKVWPVTGYQVEGPRTRNWIINGIIKYHRTIGTYLNTLISVGFTISYVNEWRPSDEQILENPYLDEEKERPMFLLISVSK
eukprot:gene6593-8161_t